MVKIISKLFLNFMLVSGNIVAQERSSFFAFGLYSKIFGMHITHYIDHIIWSMVDGFKIKRSLLEQRPTTRNVMYCQSFRILRMPFAIIFNRIIIFFIIILDFGQYYLISMVDFHSKTVFIQLYFTIRYGPYHMTISMYDICYI